MPIVKKLIFALPFLLVLVGVYQYLGIILGNPYLIFDFNVATLIQLVVFLLLLLLASLFFIIFATLASDIKLILPVAFLGALSALVMLTAPASLIIAGGFLVVFLISYLALNKKLETYLTFQPTKLLIPSITQLAALLLLVTSLAFYLTADNKIRTEGFQIPDSVLDPIIAMNMPDQPFDTAQGKPQIPPEQLQLLKQNPGLLKQYGLDPSVLDQVNTQTPQSIETSLIKTEVKKQINNLVQPQIQFLAPALAILFFFTFKFGLSILSIILYPLVGLIFTILEKIGFTQYTKEMREVKKLVV